MSTLQSTLHRLPNYAVTTVDHLDPLLCVDTYLAAEYELAAFTTAVRRTSGDAAAERAGIYWLQELDLLSVVNPLAQITAATWRKLSIQAASRLADDNPAKAEFSSTEHAHISPCIKATSKNLLSRAHKAIASSIAHVGAFFVYLFKDLILLMLTL